MKYKKKLAKLAGKQKWWDSLPESVKHATTRPGSIKK
jgi:hypothetical protein